MSGVFGLEFGAGANDHFAGFIGSGKLDTFEIIDDFTVGDGGIGRGTYTASGGASSELLIIAPDIQTMVDDANIGIQGHVVTLSSHDPAAVGFSQAPTTLLTARRRTGSVSIGGVSTPTTIWVDRGGDARLYLLNPSAGNDYAVTVGNPLTGTLSGSHTYNGIIVGAATANVGAPAAANIGSFSVLANFDGATGALSTYDGSFSGNRLTAASGTVTLSTGRFSIANASYVPSGESAMTASISGFFGGCPGHGADRRVVAKPGHANHGWRLHGQQNNSGRAVQRGDAAFELLWNCACVRDAHPNERRHIAWHVGHSLSRRVSGR